MMTDLPESLAKPSRAPALGELRAVRNLTAQYRVAAGLAYDALVKGELEWVRLVDPDAERLDDVIIGRPGKLDAYQVKWSLWKGNVTFKKLVDPTIVSGKPYPSAFSVLGSGWRALRALHPDRHVRVHYLMHDGASSSDTVPNAKPCGATHLQAFLAQAFSQRADWYRDPPESLEVWNDAIDAVATSCGLEVEELPLFLAGCELDLDHDLPAAGENSTRARDIEALAQLMLRTVVESPADGAVTLDRAGIIASLGWGKRFEAAFRHEFPIDERLYRPVAATIDQLNAAFDAHGRGYVAVIGPPGSGKSTTLTHTLRYREGIRLIRYYAFVRDDARQGRGEAAAFLRDLCLALADHTPPGFRHSPMPESLEGLRERLGELLAAMHELWSRTGVRTIILLDGLDHIEREQNPIRSLIHELPHPSTLKDGVIFVLGTQQVGLNSESVALRPIRAELEERGRKIGMAALARADVFEMLPIAVPHLAATDLIDQVYTLSGGHPLALNYLLKRLSRAADATEAATVLDGVEAYQGDIEQDYASYWDTLADEADVRELLALISRMRGIVDLDIVRRLAPEAALARFAKTAGHYFHPVTPRRWVFFHNSFRQFLLQKTGVDPFGLADAGRSRAYHSRLAEIASQEPPDSPFGWNRIYHLLQAGSETEALATASQSMLRAQFLSHRPIRDVRDDISACLRAAGSQDDRLAALRLFLADKEMSDREDALDEVDPAGLALRVAIPEDATFALFTGTALNVSPADAMEAAADLLATQPLLARRAFDAAEPLPVLSGAVAVEAKGNDEIYAWARTAWQFRPIAEVQRAILQIRVDPPLPDLAPPYAAAEEEAAQLHHELLTALAEAILTGATEADIDALVATFSEMAVPGEALLDEVRLWRARAAIAGRLDREAGAEALAALLRNLPATASLDDADAVNLADLIVQLLPADQADPYLALVTRPLTLEQHFSYSDTIGEDLEPLLVQARVLAARGRAIDPVAAVPAPREKWDEGIIFFQRVLILVGTIWGEALHGAVSPPSEVARRLRPAIRFFRRPTRDALQWHHWNQLQRAAPLLIDAVLGAAEAHGRDAFEAVAAAIESDRSDPASTDLMGWSVDMVRAVTMKLWRIDGDTAGAIEALDEAEQSIDVRFELEERVTLHRDFLLDWLILGQRERALRSFDRVLATSFGVGFHKDYQMGTWCGWAARRLRHRQVGDQAAELVAPLLNALPALFVANRGGDREDPSVELLAGIAEVEPALGLGVATALIKQGLSRRSVVTAGLLRAALTGNADAEARAILAVSHLVVPFDLSPDRELVRRLERIAARASPPVSVAALRHAIATNASANLRLSWADIVPPPSAPNRDHRDDEDDDRATTARRTHLVDAGGTAHDAVALARMAETPEKLNGLLAGAKGLDDVDWSRILDKLPDGTAGTLVEEIVDRLTRASLRPAGAFGVIACVDRFGMAARATALAEAALTRSKSHGWMRFYDGGSRLTAARAMVLLQGEAGRRRAFVLLVEDYLQGLGARELVSGLDEIVELLFDPVPIVAIWEEMREHVSALEEAKLATAIDLDNIAVHAVEQLPLALLDEALDHAVKEVATEARKGLIALAALPGASEAVLSRIRERLAGDEASQQAALELALCATGTIAEWPADLSALVSRFSWAPNSILRGLAQRFLLALGLPSPPAPPEQPLPAIYSLELPHAPMRDSGPLASAKTQGNPLPDSKDPVELTYSISDELSWLADKTGIALEILEQRALQLMKKIAPAKTWSKEAEGELLEHIKTVGPTMPYLRPRPRIAYAAFGHMVSELVDARKLRWGHGWVRSRLTTVDAILSVANPQPRPDWLAIPAADAPDAMHRREWRMAVAEALSSASMTPQGDLILAELTMTRSLDRQHPEEERAMRLVHPQEPARGAPGFDWFDFRSTRVAEAYPQLAGLDRPVPVVSGGPLHTFQSFLALNPILAADIGWRPAQDGLFRWVNDTGELMAESIWWRQGIMAHNGFVGMDAAASEGWLVIVSAAGIAPVRARLAQYDCARAARRSSGQSGDEHLAQSREAA
jgi:hypothetical protein